mgnify:CR=1 FL=1
MGSHDEGFFYVGCAAWSGNKGDKRRELLLIFESYICKGFLYFDNYLRSMGNNDMHFWYCYHSSARTQPR